MVIYIAADHRGFRLKEYLKTVLGETGYEIADLGNSVLDESDDYVDFAAAVARKISKEHDTARGIVICGSGVGADVVANKFPNVRCALAGSADQAYDARNDDDVNMLALGANYLEPDAAKKIATAWLETPFAGEARFRERIQKISELEESLLKPSASPRPTISDL